MQAKVQLQYICLLAHLNNPVPYGLLIQYVARRNAEDESQMNMLFTSQQAYSISIDDEFFHYLD